MSKIVCTKLSWGNMFSYGNNNEIVLDQSSLTQIVGTNGAGKSSIPTILEEGLYNKNSKGFKKGDIPNRYINEPYWIKNHFSIGEDNYELHIQKSSTLKASLLKNGDDISSHTASGTIKQVEDLFGFPFKTFSQLVYQSTEASLGFLTATDATRKAFLIELFDLSNYIEKKNIFDAKLKEVSSSIKFLQGSIATTESTLDRIKKQLEIEIKNPVPVPEMDEILYDTKARIKAEAEAIEEINRKIRQSNSKLEELEKHRTQEEIKADIDDLGKPEDVSELPGEIGKYKGTALSAKAVLDKLKKVEGTCPTCLQDVDPDIQSRMIAENNIIYTENMDAASDLQKKVDTSTNLANKIASLERELRSRLKAESEIIFDEKRDLESLGALKDKVLELDKLISKIKSEIEYAQSINREIAANEAKREAAKDQLTTLISELKELEEEVGEANKKLGPLEVLKKAFSPSGLVAYKIENLVIDLEVVTNEYLTRLSSGRFNLAFELVNDKLNVVIYDNGNPVSIVSLSSGERSRVVIGTLLGIRKIMQSISHHTLNVLFLDEVISVMDDEGKEQLVEVLLEEPDLNTFLVSHGWTHPLVSKIFVSKEGNISTLSYG